MCKEEQAKVAHKGELERSDDQCLPTNLFEGTEEATASADGEGSQQKLRLRRSSSAVLKRAVGRDITAEVRSQLMKRRTEESWRTIQVV